MTHKRKVQNIRQFVAHRNGANFHSRDTTEGKSEVANIWRLGDELYAQSNDAHDLLDLDPDRNGDVQPVVHPDEELDEEVDILGSQRRSLTRKGRIRERDWRRSQLGARDESGRS